MVSQSLAESVFVSKLAPGCKSHWRFFDFAEFAALFGSGSIAKQASAVVAAFVVNGNASSRSLVDNSTYVKRLLCLLSLPAGKPSESRNYDRNNPSLPAAVRAALQDCKAGPLLTGYSPTRVADLIVKFSTAGGSGELLLPGLRCSIHPNPHSSNAFETGTDENECLGPQGPVAGCECSVRRAAGVARLGEAVRGRALPALAGGMSADAATTLRSSGGALEHRVK